MKYPLDLAIYAALIGFLVNVVLSPLLIPFLIRLKFGQNVRDDGPQTHLKKAGTPTMGGIIIIIAIVIASLFFLRENQDGLMVLFVTIGFGLVGFLDDYIKVVRKRSLGLKSHQKIIAQLVITTVFVFYLTSIKKDYFDISYTSLLIPFVKGLSIDLGIFYIPVIYFIIIGTVNSVNLTDGLDGLASGVSVLVSTFFVIVAYAASSGAMTIAGAAVGSLLGFLLFNAYPAKVFMGDTGSLALGGLIASLAILLKMPLYLPIVGIIFVIEALSVMIQVVYFKFTKRRFFKMAPIHHSFELSGWSETKVVTLFYVITAIACLIGFLAAKYIM